MSDIELSIVILSYNTKQLLRECLKSLQLSIINYQLSIEVIVVDNASTDGSAEEVKDFAKKYSLKFASDTGSHPKSKKVSVSPICDNSRDLTIRLIENRANLGFAGGNNLGLKHSKGKFILFLNSDTELYPTALEQAVKFMLSDEKIGAMTSKTMLFSGGMDPDCHRGFPTPWASLTYFLGLEKLFPKSKLFGQYHQFYKNLNVPHEIDAGFGTFMLIRREVYEKVGGFDDNYFFYGEDLDYFYRIKLAGWKVMFCSEPLLRHHKGGSSGLRKESKEVTPASKETRIKTAKASIKAMEIFYQKFYQDKYPAWVAFLVLLTIKIKGFFRILKHYLR